MEIKMDAYWGNGSLMGKAKHLVDYYYDDQLRETGGPGWACSRETEVF